MIMNFMATYTNLLALKATSRRDITVCQRNNKEGKTPHLIFPLLNMKYLFAIELIKTPPCPQLYMDIHFTNYPKLSLSKE